MNELAKAMFRLSWSMSCYGAQQATRLLTGGGWQQTSTSLQELERTARDNVDGPFRNLLETGDRIGSGFFETAADLAAGRGAGFPEAFDSARDTLDRSWDALRRNLIPGSRA
jgi:hypothetical protein